MTAVGLGTRAVWMGLAVVGWFTLAHVDLCDAEDVTLITVNGEEITAAEIDQRIMGAHQSMNMDAANNEFMQRLLEKAVNDRLILQQARAIGMDEESSILEPLMKDRTAHAVSVYVGEMFQAPTEVSAEAIRAYFEKYYFWVQLRQLSVRSREEAEDLARRIRAGESMDALAKELSLDTNKLRGGAHNRKLWADVENVLRDVGKNLSVGQLSEPFPFREAWSILRVEERTTPDLSELPEYERSIRNALLAEQAAVRWEEFVADYLRRTPVVESAAVLGAIDADADVVFDGEFLRTDDRPVLWTDENHVITGTKLRRRISLAGMEARTSPYEEIRDAALARARQDLVLETHAAREGYLDRPEVVQAFQEKLDTTLLTQYLEDTITQKIRFNRQEFQEFYERNSDQFRGPEEVKLSFLMLDDENSARAAAERLAAGADFDFVRRELQLSEDHGADTSKWTSVEMFSESLRDAIAGVQPGGTTDALPMAESWMVVRVDGRRSGEVQPLEDVEMAIREAMFRKKFNDLLDEHLSLLKERSEIVRHEDRIRAYFEVGS